MKKTPEAAVGALVAFNNLDDAAWFEVLEIDGFTLTLREYDGQGTNYAKQYMDKSLVKQVRAKP
jgi:hypothetical protein